MKNNTMLLTLLALLSFSANGIAQESNLNYPIVDTGVSEFYSNTGIISEPITGDTFHGQDAQYQINNPSYTDNGDGTITDNVTGLIWMKDM